MSWNDVAAELLGINHAERVPVLTFAGTWAPPGTGYPSDVVAEAGPMFYEVPVLAPWSFGPIGGPDKKAPSYQQSVDEAVGWALDWLAFWGGPFVLGGYSQGAEAASRVAMALQEAPLLGDNMLGGFTFGNPCRISNGKVRGIATVRFDEMPPGWVDYVNTGDIYAEVPDNNTGDIMMRVYEIATAAQINDPGAFARDLVRGIIGIMEELGLTSVLPGILLSLGNPVVLIAQLTGALLKGGLDSGLVSAIRAAILGLKFITTQPPTWPHISYLESGGVTHAVAHLRSLAPVLV